MSTKYWTAVASLGGSLYLSTFSDGSEEGSAVLHSGQPVDGAKNKAFRYGDYRSFSYTRIPDHAGWGEGRASLLTVEMETLEKKY